VYPVRGFVHLRGERTFGQINCGLVVATLLDRVGEHSFASLASCLAFPADAIAAIGAQSSVRNCLLDEWNVIPRLCQ